MNVPDAVRLGLRFDAAALAAEALLIPPADWTPHFNRGIYEGEWSGVALRSVGGLPAQIYPDPAPTARFADTEMLERLPAHRTALDQFECPITAARLLALAPGAFIKEHTDYRLGFADGEIRVHVPIVTSERVEFVLDGRRVDMGAGEAWYLDLNRPHRVCNNSAVTRVHLVVDCVVDEWLSNLVRQAIFSATNDLGWPVALGDRRTGGVGR